MAAISIGPISIFYVMSPCPLFCGHTLQCLSIASKWNQSIRIDKSKPDQHYNSLGLWFWFCILIFYECLNEQNIHKNLLTCSDKTIYKSRWLIQCLIKKRRTDQLVHYCPHGNSLIYNSFNLRATNVTIIPIEKGFSLFSSRVNISKMKKSTTNVQLRQSRSHMLI